MVDDRAVERLGGVGEAASSAAIAVAGRGIAAGMIVGEHDPGAAMKRGIGDDPAERKIGAALVARMARQVEAVRLIIEMRDPQAFPRRIGIGHAAGEEGAGGSQAVELQQLLDAVVAAAVEEWGRNDPPQSPIPGACYLVGDTPTGEWSLYPAHLAAFGGAGWRFVEPVVGLAVVVKTSGLIATYLPDGWDVGTVRASRIVVDGKQLIGAQAAAIADPVDGTVIDSEARIAIAEMLSALRQHGLIASE